MYRPGAMSALGADAIPDLVELQRHGRFSFGPSGREPIDFETEDHDESRRPANRRKVSA